MAESSGADRASEPPCLTRQLQKVMLHTDRRGGCLTKLLSGVGGSIPCNEAASQLIDEASKVCVRNLVLSISLTAQVA